MFIYLQKTGQIYSIGQKYAVYSGSLYDVYRVFLKNITAQTVKYDTHGHSVAALLLTSLFTELTLEFFSETQVTLCIKCSLN